MRKICIPYEPHRLQKILHDDKHRFKTIVCGRRWGKTIFAINELLKQALLTPHTDYWYVAPIYKQAKLIAWQRFKYYAATAAIKFNEAELLLTLINGSTIRLVGADSADSLRGVGLSGVVIDEFADIKRTVWQSVIRPTLSDKEGWAIFLGTPRGKLNQLYEMFITDPIQNDKHYKNIDGQNISSNENFKSWKFLTSDNPYILKEEIEQARRELAPQYFRQEYEASFENYTGLIYKEFDINKHIVKRENFKLESWHNVYVGIDTGRFSSISFLAIDNNGIAFLFDEIYDYDGIVAHITEMIHHKLAANRIDKSKVKFFIDSASQVKQEYKFNKIICYDAKKNIQNQIALVRNKFATNGLFFCDNCSMHIIEHQGYSWDEHSIKIKPKDENDHTCNSLQYIFSTYNVHKSIDTQKIEDYKKTLEYAAAQREYSDFGRAF